MSRTHISYITVKELFDFACWAAERWKPGDLTPISKTRAKAWSMNPYADPADVALLVAEAHGRCVGHLGLVPARLRMGPDVEKIHWSSALYVAPEHRLTGAGILLIRAALRLDYNIAAFGPSPEATRLLRAAGFSECPPLVCVKCDLGRLDLIGLFCRGIRKVVRRSTGGVSAIKAINKGVQLGGAVTRALAYPILCSLVRPCSPASAFRRIDALPEQAFDLYQCRNGSMRFDRDVRVIGWMLAHPWVTSDPRQATPGCYFSDFQEDFEYEVFEPSGGGFVVLLRWSRGGARVLRVLDWHFAESSQAGLLASLAVQRAKAFGADTLILPRECAAQLESLPVVRLLCSTATRKTFIRFRSSESKFAQAIDRLAPHYCDGDVPFA